ncbi:hypothetical protein L249_2710 [Ophiocordyceps polyrhachis-furcata BCC 54312]|uniref:Uncharacterized protein n=1 Tax=Ophiocordyceps polyrhachis-furcata BCC 54312 TaxID=1330021 RepID=A0A367LN63_9HYPO|nr:hypothetical protein L249_2710 [Ophiocordyceps polyrhachis-furcata BCC 54312]
MSKRLCCVVRPETGYGPSLPSVRSWVIDLDAFDGMFFIHLSVPPPPCRRSTEGAVGAPPLSVAFPQRLSPSPVSATPLSGKSPERGGKRPSPAAVCCRPGEMRGEKSRERRPYLLRPGTANVEGRDGQAILVKAGQSDLNEETTRNGRQQTDQGGKEATK